MATAHDARFPFTALRIYQQGSQAVVQPATDASGPVPTLLVDLASGSVTLSPTKDVLRGSNFTEALGLLGVCKLSKGAALVAVTQARRVADVPAPAGAAAAVYEVAGAAVLSDPGSERASGNRQLLALLRDAVDPAGSGRGVYFSHHMDLTLSEQRAADAEAAPAPPPLGSAEHATPRFWYNRTLAAPVLAAGPGASRFVPPAILGFVRQLPDLAFAGGRKATLTLIARRGVDRAGTRQWRRGCDSVGNVANFVETEQILSTPAGDVASYVEVRGSIPLLWTQLPNIKYKPTTVIAAAGQSASVFDAHVKSLRQAYGDVSAVNLINHKGTEGKLEVAFRAEAVRYCSASPAAGLHYLAFDFHHECSKGRYHRLGLLWDKVQGEFNRHGFFVRRGGVVEKRQVGVVRTNCIDCLDRTNVVQGVLGRKALEAQLQVLGLYPTPSPAGGLPEAFPAVEKEFKVLWADHGDAISMQYAGTGAMKSGFTRTGKRTFGGLVDDGVKAVVRYYVNNFQDGRKQDAVDLITGAYVPAPGAPVPVRPQASPLVPILLAIALIVYGAHQAGQVLSGDLAAALGAAAATDGAASAANATDAANATAAAAANGTAAAANGTAASGVAAVAAVQAGLTGLLARVLLPLVVGVGLLGFVVSNGKHLVNKPQLCPQLAVTVRVAKGAKAGKDKAA